MLLHHQLVLTKPTGTGSEATPTDPATKPSGSATGPSSPGGSVVTLLSPNQLFKLLRFRTPPLLL